MIGKPKELWEFLMFLNIPNQTVISNFVVTEENDTLTYEIRSSCKTFKNF